VIKSAVPGPARFASGHPAKRSFQALRIAVNDELDQLDEALPLAWRILRPGGRLGGISFHSLEDRRVKRFLADRARGCICPPELPVCVCGRQPEAELIVSGGATPGPDEVSRNPRAASARLRAARKLTPEAAPRIPRRMSGPATGAVAVPLPRLPARPVAPGRRRPGRHAPRTHPSRARRLQRRPVHALAGRVWEWLLDLPDHTLLDRLIRGRAWIALLTFALIGIVAMQVSLLKLNAGIGRAVQTQTALERENAALRAQVSRLSSGERVLAAGHHLGLVLAPAGEVKFLTVRPGADARRASAALRDGTLKPAPGSAPAGSDASGVVGAPTSASTSTTASASASATTTGAATTATGVPATTAAAGSGAAPASATGAPTAATGAPAAATGTRATSPATARSVAPSTSRAVAPSTATATPPPGARALVPSRTRRRVSASGTRR